jgi:CHAT domain-containing protein
MQTAQVAVQPGSNQSFELSAGTSEDFALPLPAGKVAAVTFQQTESVIRVRLHDEGSHSDPDPHFNLGGRLSSIVFRAAGIDAPDVGFAVFTVENKSRRTAKFQLTIAPPHSPSPADTAAAQAERESAHALFLSSTQVTASVRESLPFFDSAEADWRRAGDAAALAQVLSVHAYNQAFLLKDETAALKLLPELLSLAKTLAAEQPAEAANAYKTAGFIHANQSIFEEALQEYAQALRLFETTGDLFNRVVMLENRSKIERIQGDNEHALADVEAALPLAHQNRDARGEEALEVERGAIAYESGQLGPAYESDLRAISIAQPSAAGFLEAEAWSDLALVYLDLHDYEQSSQALDRAEAIWKQSTNTYGQLETRENRAELRLAQGDLAGARRVFEQGAEEAQAHALTREHVAFLLGVAACAMRSGHAAEAESLLHQAIAEAEQSQIADELSALYAALGDAEASEDHWDTAAEAWRKADAAAQKRGHDLDRSIALGGLARAALHLDQLDEAHTRCQEAMTALESVRRQINDNDLRLTFFSSRHALYDLCVQVEMRRGDAESAFDAAERSRARTLLDQAVSSRPRSEVPTEFLARMTANQRALAAAGKALRFSSRHLSSVRSPAQDKPLPSPAGGMAAILGQREQLRQEARQRGYDLALAAAAMPFTESEVVQHLDEQTALLAYWLGEQKSYLWLVAKSGVAVHSLPSSRELDTRVRKYLALVQDAAASSATGSAHERSASIRLMQQQAHAAGLSLDRALFPFAIPPQIKRLLIVKDGGLHSLSFAALPRSSSAYLASSYELADEPSATFAFRALQPHPVSPHPKIVAFIDPYSDPYSGDAASLSSPPAALHRTAWQSPSLSASASGQWTSPLPYAREEARVLRETFGAQNATIFTGLTATRAQALGLDWSAYSLAHFAAHAVYRKTHPELSGIVLSPGGSSGSASSDPPTANLLSFSDVLQMKTPPALVVLSACSSGIGRYLPGEGMMALDTAFLAAGSSQVVSTLWPVDDQASSVFMRAFYHAFASTHSAIESLRRAQRQMAASRDWNAPYYWGAFTLSGDWRTIANPSSAHP